MSKFYVRVSKIFCRAVAIEVVSIAVQNNRNIRFQKQKILFVFARFRNKIVVSVQITVRKSKITSADMRGKLQSRRFENVRNHCRTRRFSVAASNSNSFFE